MKSKVIAMLWWSSNEHLIFSTDITSVISWGKRIEIRAKTLIVVMKSHKGNYSLLICSKQITIISLLSTTCTNITTGNIWLLYGVDG